MDCNAAFRFKALLFTATKKLSFWADYGPIPPNSGLYKKIVAQKALTYW